MYKRSSNARDDTRVALRRAFAICRAVEGKIPKLTQTLRKKKMRAMIYALKHIFKINPPPFPPRS